MSAKARSLRERMSIDPDAPSPVAERRPRPRAAEPAAPTPPQEPEPVREEPAPVPEPVDARADDTRAETDEAAPVPSAPTTSTRPEPRPRSSSTRAPGRRARRPAKERVEWETALADPAISADGNGYRSFYVSDEVFARFRAAVYWTARRPDVDGVPDNMSVGVEEYMDSVATDLERRFNDRSVFPPTPDQIRAHRKRQNKS